MDGAKARDEHVVKDGRFSSKLPETHLNLAHYFAESPAMKERRHNTERGDKNANRQVIKRQRSQQIARLWKRRHYVFQNHSGW